MATGTGQGQLQEPTEQRQIFRLKSIDTFKPLNNLVLIKPILKNEYRKTENGLFITPTEWRNQPNHVDRIGHIIKLPDKLFFNDSKKWKTVYDRQRKVHRNLYTYKYPNQSMQWDIDMQLRVGDKVLFNYLEAINCPMILVGEKDEVYYLMRYEEVYAIRREDEIIPINGYLICERVKKEKLSDLDHVSQNYYDNRYLKSKYIGKPVKRYFGGTLDCDTEIRPGDKLLKVNPDIAPETEYKYHAEFFDESESYVFIQRRLIHVILN